jgi:hypothetical protein
MDIAVSMDAPASTDVAL